MPQIDGHDVLVIESPRRKKTASARLVGNTIEVRVPAGLRKSERERHVRELSQKVVRKRSAERVDLDSRARKLAAEHELPVPTAISWSSRQNTRWGSCTPATGAVRISHRLSQYPGWVLDYVIVHELAHLVHGNHSPEFHALVARYEKAERAEGFLCAVSLGHAGAISGLSEGTACADGAGHIDE